MQKIDTLLDEASRALTPCSSDSQTEAGQTRQADRAQADLVDAINQIFAEFELAYHNQYQKAYSDPTRLVMTKKYWLECLSDIHPPLLVAAVRRLVKNEDYLPTISAIRRVCRESLDLFGLPSERDAYTEACRAPAPKALYGWSHAAVYQAGKATDWFLLATEPEEKVFPLFCWYYRQACQRVMEGEQLDVPMTQALAERPSRVLSYEERQQRMQALRETLDM